MTQFDRKVALRKINGGAPRQAAANPQVFTIDGETPDRQPTVGSVVVVQYGDPNLVGGPLADMPMIVTRVVGDGRVNGYIVTDPTAVAMGPEPGQQIPLPPMMPVVNSPYGVGRAMCWRWP